MRDDQYYTIRILMSNDLCNRLYDGAQITLLLVNVVDYLPDSPKFSCLVIGIVHGTFSSKLLLDIMVDS